MNRDEEAERTPAFRTRIAFATPWFNVLERSPVAGGDAYFAVKPRDYVSVLAVTGDDEIVLVRQFRPAIEQWTWEFPSGTVDGDEEPVAAMTRELREETGYRPTRMVELGVLQPDTGRLANRLFAFFAEVEPDPQRLQPEADEWSLRPLIVPRKDFIAGYREGPEPLRQALHMAVMHLAAARGVFDILRPHPYQSG